MNRWAPALLRHLDNLVRLNEKLLKLGKQRHTAMVARDVDRLESILAEEHRVGQAIIEEERARQATMVHLGAAQGKPPEQMVEMRLPEVAQWLGEPARTQLLALRQRLEQAVARVQEANRIMTMLAQQMLPHFGELLEILLGGTPGGRAYTADGQAVRSGAAGMNVLDMQA